MLNKLIESVLKSPGLVIVALLAIISLGIYKYQQMPVDAFPDISPVMVPVFAEGHGMAPEEIERLITYPIESAMNGLPKVTQIKSTSAFGMAVVYVYFEDDVDIYFARQLVAERLAAASVGSSCASSRMAAKVGCLNNALSSILILASRATRLSCPSMINGLTSSRLRSFSMNSLYSANMMLVN